ncbi:MAG: hypothetical protein ACJ72N_14320 [Labedaea sp.]
MTDNVISLLASLGFDDAVTNPDGIVIDNFDQWTNPDSPALSTVCTPCTMELAEEAA